jgi:hypothetical protein
MEQYGGNESRTMQRSPRPLDTSPRRRVGGAGMAPLATRYHWENKENEDDRIADYAQAHCGVMEADPVGLAI